VHVHSSPRAEKPKRPSSASSERSPSMRVRSTRPAPHRITRTRSCVWGARARRPSSTASWCRSSRLLSREERGLLLLRAAHASMAAADEAPRADGAVPSHPNLRPAMRLHGRRSEAPLTREGALGSAIAYLEEGRRDPASPWAPELGLSLALALGRAGEARSRRRGARGGARDGRHVDTQRALRRSERRRAGARGPRRRAIQPQRARPGKPTCARPLDPSTPSTPARRSRGSAPGVAKPKPRSPAPRPAARGPR
jgi:hypothetical protein